MSTCDRSSRGRGPWARLVRSIFATSLFAVFCALPAFAAGDPRGFLGDDDIGVPLRVRDYTFPSFLVLGFAPMPSAPLGRGNYAFEFHGSVINDFQASDAVENYLAQTRGDGVRRALDQQDVEAILSLPEGQAFYIDAEYDAADFAFFYGLADNLDVGLAVTALHYTTGRLDDSIFDFHQDVGYGQQGRDYVLDNHFQVVFGGGGKLPPLVTLDGSGVSGIGDPSLFLRYAFRSRSNGWQYGLTLGVKPPVADTTRFLSTGSWDYGLQLVGDRRFENSALIVNLSAVKAGTFEQNGFDPPVLPALHLSYIYRFRRMPRTRVMLQALVAEHPFRDLVDSELTELETQLSLAMKWNTPLGVFGLGLTENLFNMDNTPDIGLHLSWGLLVKRDDQP